MVEERNSPRNKPIDRWLGLLATAVGILLYLLPKTEPVIIGCIVLIWAFLVHPTLNFWWIEDRPWRKATALLILTGLLIWLGFVIRPENAAVRSEAVSPPQPAPTTPMPVPTPMEPVSPKSKPVPRNRSLHASAFLQIEKPEILQQYSIVGTGKKWGGNVRSQNPGPERVFEAYGFSRVYLEECRSENVDSLDAKVIAAFKKEIQEQKAEYHAGQVKGVPVVGAGDGPWGTALTDPLSEHQADGLFDGSVRLYIASWAIWKDQHGVEDTAVDCRWLQPLPKRQYSKEEIVWHYCQSDTAPTFTSRTGFVFVRPGLVNAQGEREYFIIPSQLKRPLFNVDVVLLNGLAGGATTHFDEIDPRPATTNTFPPTVVWKASLTALKEESLQFEIQSRDADFEIILDVHPTGPDAFPDFYTQVVDRTAQKTVLQCKTANLKIEFPNIKPTVCP